MYIRTVALVFFLLTITAGLKVGELLFPSLRERPNMSYECEGPCVPVYFELHVPESQSLYRQVYVSGNFNGWIHADPALRLKQVDESEYRAVIFLPDGEKVSYRYTVGRDHKYGFTEYGDLRSLKVMDSHVRRDSISKWGAGLITSGIWNPEKLERQGIQWLFLDKYLQGSLMTYPVTVAKIDSLFKSAEDIWMQESPLYYPGYDQLLSRTYQEVYDTQMVLGKHDSDRTMECYVKAKYVLPAFLREVGYVESNPEPSRYSLLNNWPNLADIIHCDGLSDDQLEALHLLYHDRIPNLISVLPTQIDTVHFNYKRFSDSIAKYGLDYSH